MGFDVWSNEICPKILMALPVYLSFNQKDRNQYVLANGFFDFRTHLIYMTHLRALEGVSSPLNCWCSKDKLCHHVPCASLDLVLVLKVLGVA
jgi:hypothetical protein